MPKPADLEHFNVKKPRSTSSTSTEKIQLLPPREKKGPQLITKGLRMTPEAAHQFAVLCAEVGKLDPKNAGPRLTAEALNWLFRKYGKPPIA